MLGAFLDARVPTAARNKLLVGFRIKGNEVFLFEADLLTLAQTRHSAVALSVLLGLGAWWLAFGFRPVPPAGGS